MALQMRDVASVLEAASVLRGRDVGGTLRIFQMAKLRDATALRTVYTAMTGAIAPASISKVAATRNPLAPAATVTTSTVTATPTGGTAPYTYAWVTDNPVIVANSPAAATTSFHALLSPGDTETGTATCTITDANGAHVDVIVAVSLEYRVV